MGSKGTIVINLLNSNRSRSSNWRSELPEVVVRTVRDRDAGIVKVSLITDKIFRKFYDKTYLGQLIVPA